MKKILALVVAALMLIGMTAALAEDTYKITITANANNDTHTYAAYQIMTGVLDKDETSPTKGQLQNLEWGTGVNGANLLTALQADSTIGGDFTGLDSTAPSVASGMAKCNTSAKAEALAAVIGAYVKSAGLSAVGTYADNEITGLDQGYYFVEDTSTDLTNDTKSEYILNVVGDTVVTAKDNTVTLIKKVDDENDSTSDEDSISWQDTADYDVGDVIPYKLQGTLPANYAKYDFFDYSFSDTMCNGLTLNRDSVKVVYYADDTAVAADTAATGGTDITSYFAISPDEDAAGATMTISIASAFDQDGKVTDAGLKKITGIDKDSVIVVYYTATLNDNAVIGSAGNENTATLTFSNNPNATGEGDNTTSTTPEDTNIVFTYKVVVNKVDENKKPLAGATFTLYKAIDKDDDEYEGATLGSAIKSALGASIEATALADDVKYITVGTMEAKAVTNEDKEVISYTASFNHIDDGSYVLVETVVPDGYNSWASQDFEVTATHTQDPKTLELSNLDGGDLASGVVSTGAITKDIQNNSGVVLPSTGGIGTTIFYVGGGILVLLAVILLVTKRRMSSND